MSIGLHPPKAFEDYRWVVWEETPGYQSAKAEFLLQLVGVRARLRDRGFHGYLSNDPGYGPGGFNVWLNPIAVSYRDLSSEEAKQFALCYGDAGYWTLPELAAFAYDPEHSMIFKWAMRDLGFRPSRRTASGWARRSKGDIVDLTQLDMSPTKILSRESFDDTYQPRLIGGGQQVCHWGMGVDAGGIIRWGPAVGAMSQRRHLASQQYEFTLRGRNLVVQPDGDRYVEVLAVARHNRLVRVVWPSRVHDQETARYLLDDLVDRLSIDR